MRGAALAALVLAAALSASAASAQPAPPDPAAAQPAPEAAAAQPAPEAAAPQPAPEPAAPQPAPEPAAPQPPPDPAAVPPTSNPAALAPALVARSPGPRTRITWDLNAEGGLGYAFEGDGHPSGLGRLRGGVLVMNEANLESPVFYALGLTYEASDLSPATIGLQGEVLMLSAGAWLQLGGLIDLMRVRPGFMASAGFSVVGAEVQMRGDADQKTIWAVYGKLRVPIRLIALAFED